jgi:hypothetical protein
MNNRQEIVNELKLRESIRRIIKIVREEKRVEEQQTLDEHAELRSVVRKLILLEQESFEEPQDESTVELEIAETIKEIRGVLFADEAEKKGDYVKLKEPERRRGFFAGLLAGLKNKFDEYDSIGDVEGDVESLDEEEIEINIEDDEEVQPGEELLIPVDEPEEEPEQEKPEPFEPPVPAVEETPEYIFGYKSAIQDTVAQIWPGILNHYSKFNESGDVENAKVYRDWLIINIGLHMNLKEKELTGSFPELPADFAAELEKFKAQGVEGIPDVGGEAPLPPMPEPDEEPLPEV